MSIQPRGVTPLDRYRSRLNSAGRICDACGYEDGDADWIAETSGRRIRYRHVCPGCGAESRREYRLD